MKVVIHKKRIGQIRVRWSVYILADTALITGSCKLCESSMWGDKEGNFQAKLLGKFERELRHY